MCQAWPPLCVQLCPSLKLIIILQLLGGIISLDGASVMSICSWFIPALWRHPLSLHTMDNNRCFMKAEDGCEVSSLYMAWIPGTLIHLQSSKVRARCLLRSIKLRAVTWRLSVSSGTHWGTHHHGKHVLLLLRHLLLLHLSPSTALVTSGNPWSNLNLSECLIITIAFMLRLNY